jgi:hypothetical protein
MLDEYRVDIEKDGTLFRFRQFGVSVHGSLRFPAPHVYNLVDLVTTWQAKQKPFI